MSEYYQVQWYYPHDNDWVPIKSWDRRTGLFLMDSNERLTLGEAKQRYEHLSAQHRLETFRVFGPITDTE
ncbi:MAG: hypothetical protein BGO21_08550 [Dyadobacter sp. 50-39]|nr:MAG: hypothetical protein BGO21_08550 [Dyadobacter sp. 50-39]